MYKTIFYDDSYSDQYNYELSRFVSSNTAEILTCDLEDIGAEDTDYDLRYLFPEAYVDTHSRSDCRKVLKTLRDRMKSSVLYDTLTPLQEYVLCYSIDGWIELERSLDIDLHKSAPDYLKKLIEKENEEPEYVLPVIEDLGEYSDIFVEDWDFEPESLRGFVQAAIHNTKYFLSMMSFEELDQYVEIMPIDVAEEYIAFREKDSESNFNERDKKMENSGHTTINVYGNISDSQIQIGTVNSNQTINNNETFPYEEVLKAVTEIDKYKDMLIQDLGEKGEQFTNVLDEFSEAVQKRDDPSKIRKALDLLQDFMVGVSGSLAASGVLSLLQNIKF